MRVGGRRVEMDVWKWRMEATRERKGRKHQASVPRIIACRASSRGLARMRGCRGTSHESGRKTGRDEEDVWKWRMEATHKRKRRKRRTSVPWCANAQLARKAMRVG